MFDAAVASLSKDDSDYCLAMFASKRVRQMAHDSLAETGRFERRRRCLPALVVLWLVVMLALHMSASIPNVYLRLRQAARARWGRAEMPAVTDEALCHARSRLGVEPLVALFKKTTQQITPVASLGGYNAYIIDGTSCDLPDTPENEARFGRPETSRGRAAFPQLKLVLLIHAATRQVKAVVILPCRTSEVAALPELLSHLAAGDLLLVDRGFAAYPLLRECQERGIQVVMRINSGFKPVVTQRLGVGDYLVEGTYWEPIPPDQRVAKGRKTRPVTVKARLVVAWFRDKKHPLRLLTTLPASAASAWDIAVGYHVRWEVELAIDELKTHLASVLHGSIHTVFRGKSPPMVLQEVYGLLAAYNLIRATMAEAAEVHGLDPLNLSFVGSLEVLRSSAPYLLVRPVEDWPELRVQLLRDIAACHLREPRRPKCYPRKVKRKMSNFQIKRPEDVGFTCHFKEEIVLYGPS